MKRTKANTTTHLKAWLSNSKPGDEVEYWHAKPSVQKKGLVIPNNWRLDNAPAIIALDRSYYDSGMVELAQRRGKNGIHYVAQRRAVERLPQYPFGYRPRRLAA